MQVANEEVVLVADDNKLDKRQQHRISAVSNAIENIITVSNKVLEDLKGGFYSRHYTKNSESIYCYTDKKISDGEEAFYKTCSTAEGLIKRNHEQIMSEFGEKYELFPVLDFSDEQLKGYFILYIIYIRMKILN